ncbi:MAG: glycosyltransferase family 4 protein [Propioniciclava sp.]
MHVALLTHHYLPEAGAPQRRWRAFVRRFRAAGHEVTVFTPPPHYPSGQLMDQSDAYRPGSITQGAFGETIIRVRFRAHTQQLVSRSIDQAIAAADSVASGMRHFRYRPKPDVIIATAPGLPTIPAGMALGALLRRPVAVEMRDAWPDLIEPSGMLGPQDARSLMRHTTVHTAHTLITRMQTQADAVVTTTQSFAEILRQRGVPRVHVIRNGYTPDIVPALPQPAPHEGLRVLYVGTMGRSQGLDGVVDATVIARGQGTDISVRVIGTGAEEPALRRQAELLDAPVEFLGRMPREKIWEHYAWSDSAVVSLRDWPPLAWTIPSKLYEALGTQRHVSGVLRGESADVIREADAGLVSPPGSPRKLAEQWQRLAAYREPLCVGSSGRRWVTEHAHHDALAHDYLAVLNDLVERKRRRLIYRGSRHR